MGYPNPGGGTDDKVIIDDIADAGTTGKAVLKSETQPLARGALGLGDSATKNAGTETGNVMLVGAFGLGVGPQHKDDAYNNIGQIYRVNSSSTSTPGGSVYGVISLPCDGGPTTGYMAVSDGGAGYLGYSSTQAKGVTWTRILTDTYRPAATKTALGFVKQSEEVADSTATDLAGLNAKLNELLAALRTAGIVSTGTKEAK